MVPWWLIPLTGAVVVVLFGALVAGARDDDRRRIVELEVACAKAYRDLHAAAQAAWSTPGPLERALDVLSEALTRE
ncbi:MAG: hypothetical protein QME79_12440 [Bacillota bacterium]|nr:hypothetical protein [Bacillota bacterium]